jgi:cellulose 1,4-beta-cellobiosidase
MDEDGGTSKYPENKAGAKYGVGYCDAQCPHDIKFINGEANVDGWNPSPSDPNSGMGKYGSCCAEFDIWEANKISSAYTSHPCSTEGDGPYRCSSKEECGDGDNRPTGKCDKDGCDLNPFRFGDHDFFGEGKTIDTTKKFTVVT